MSALRFRPGVMKSDGPHSHTVQRYLFRDMGAWFPRGAGGVPTAASLPSSSLATPATGRTVELAFIQYQVPISEPFQIHGLQANCNNNRSDVAGSVTENVFSPRMRFQFYGAHPVYGGPYNVLDASYTPETFGAATFVTTGATSATQTLTSTTGLAVGSKVRFINSGTNDVIATVLTVNSATSVTFTNPITTTTGQVCCAFHALDAGSPNNSNTGNINFTFGQAIQVVEPPANGKIFLAFMVEHASTHATWSETALTLLAQGGDIIRWGYNGGAAFMSNGDAYWSGASLGTNIATATFPSDPQSGNNFTAGGSGNAWTNTNFGINWSEL